MRKTIEELQRELKATARELRAQKTQVRQVRDGLSQALTALDAMVVQQDNAQRHFHNFVGRFDEVVEILVDHDTEQLRRVTRVEDDTARLKQQVSEALLRIQQLEEKAG